MGKKDIAKLPKLDWSAIKKNLEHVIPMPKPVKLNDDTLKALTLSYKEELLDEISNNVHEVKQNTRSSMWKNIIISVVSAIIGGIIVGIVLEYMF